MIRSVSTFFKSLTRKSKGKTRLPKLRGKVDIETLRFAYEILIQHKQENIQQHKSATGHLIAMVEKRKSSLPHVTDDINKLKNQLAEVKNQIHSLTDELQQAGKSQEEIEQHPDYIRFQSGYSAIQSSLDEKNERFSTLQQECNKAQDRIESFKSQLHQLHQEIEKIQEEQDETIHAHLSILQDKEIADILAGMR